MSVTKKIGLALAVAGVCLAVVFFFKAQGVTYDLGLAWNLKNMEVVFSDTVQERYMTGIEIKDNYKAYGNMPDEELFTRIHAKYFDKTPIEEYRRLFFSSRPSGLKKPEGAVDDLMIDGIIEELYPFNVLSRTIMMQDALDYGLLSMTRHKSAFPYRYALFAGMAMVMAGLAISLVPRKK